MCCPWFCQCFTRLYTERTPNLFVKKLPLTFLLVMETSLAAHAHLGKRIIWERGGGGNPLIDFKADKISNVRLMNWTLLKSWRLPMADQHLLIQSLHSVLPYHIYISNYILCYHPTLEVTYMSKRNVGRTECTSCSSGTKGTNTCVASIILFIIPTLSLINSRLSIIKFRS